MMKVIKMFKADWCGPCDEQAEIVSTVVEQRDDVEIQKFDVEEDSDVANQYNVNSLPTLVVEKDEQTVEQLTGLQTENELMTTLNNV
jgi:thioredoxin 1